jgi:hypothetical protein
MSLNTALAIAILVDVAFIAGLGLVLTPWKLRRHPGASLDRMAEEFECEEAAPSWNGTPAGIIPH